MPWELSLAAHGERVSRAYCKYTEPPSDTGLWVRSSWSGKRTNQERLREDPGAGSCNLQHAWNQNCITTGGDPPHDLRRQKLMAYHALRTIANNNEASNCYFLLDKNKNKTQARLHLMMKKKKPLETIEALIPRNFVEDFQKRANRERLDEIAPWRLKLPKFDKSNLSFGNGDPLRMLVAKERIEDLRGKLLCFTDASKTEDGKAGIGIYIQQKDLKLSIRTSSHSSISSTELAAIESCLLHMKESYQGDILNLVILLIPWVFWWTWKKATMPTTTPMFTEFFLLFQSFKKKAKKSHWSGYLPMSEFLEMSKRTPWQKLLQPRIQLSAGFRKQSRT